MKETLIIKFDISEIGNIIELGGKKFEIYNIFDLKNNILIILKEVNGKKILKIANSYRNKKYLDYNIKVSVFKKNNVDYIKLDIENDENLQKNTKDSSKKIIQNNKINYDILNEYKININYDNSVPMVLSK